jgi:putative transposase
LEIEGGVISSLMQQAIPAQAGGDYAMTSHSTMPDRPQPETETAVQLFDNWFDPIEAGLRDRAREFLQAMLEAELDEVLERSRYARRAKRSTRDSEEPAGVTGHRHGHRSRTLLGTFGQVKIEVPRARLDTPDGKTTEWKSQALRAYQRRTEAADALIAGCYLSGTNTRRVRRALRALFGGAVGKDTVSRVWRKVKSDWEAWNARSLVDEPIVRLILDGTVIVDGAPGLENAIAAVWDGVLVQRCTVHKHRNLLAHAPERLHEEISADYNAMIYAATREEIERQRKAFIRKWRLKHHPVGSRR